jgi:hypothetical protein
MIRLTNGTTMINECELTHDDVGPCVCEEHNLACAGTMTSVLWRVLSSGGIKTGRD